MLSPRTIYRPSGFCSTPLSSQKMRSWLCSSITLMVWSKPRSLPWSNKEHPQGRHREQKDGKEREGEEEGGAVGLKASRGRSLTTIFRPSFVTMFTISAHTHQTRLEAAVPVAPHSIIQKKTSKRNCHYASKSCWRRVVTHCSEALAAPCFASFLLILSLPQRASPCTNVLAQKARNDKPVLVS